MIARLIVCIVWVAFLSWGQPLTSLLDAVENLTNITSKYTPPALEPTNPFDLPPLSMIADKLMAKMMQSEATGQQNGSSRHIGDMFRRPSGIRSDNLRHRRKAKG